MQCGVVRTNCVDCIDRTNGAQHSTGRAALGFQLYAMGMSTEPVISPSSDLAAVLRELYDAMGNNIARQYAGSQVLDICRKPITTHCNLKAEGNKKIRFLMFAFLLCIVAVAMPTKITSFSSSFFF
jgi:hypothetical protein